MCMATAMHVLLFMFVTLDTSQDDRSPLKDCAHINTASARAHTHGRMCKPTMHQPTVCRYRCKHGNVAKAEKQEGSFCGDSRARTECHARHTRYVPGRQVAGIYRHRERCTINIQTHQQHHHMHTRAREHERMCKPTMHQATVCKHGNVAKAESKRAALWRQPCSYFCPCSSHSIRPRTISRR